MSNLSFRFGLFSKGDDVINKSTLTDYLKEKHSDARNSHAMVSLRVLGVRVYARVHPPPFPTQPIFDFIGCGDFSTRKLGDKMQIFL